MLVISLSEIEDNIEYAFYLFNCNKMSLYVPIVRLGTRASDVNRSCNARFIGEHDIVSQTGDLI